MQMDEADVAHASAKQLIAQLEQLEVGAPARKTKPSSSARK